MSGCDVPEANLGFCVRGDPLTCSKTARDGVVGCSTDTTNADACRAASCTWDGAVCFNQRFLSTTPMVASDVGVVNARLSEQRLEMQRRNPSMTQQAAAGDAANTLQLIRNRLPNAPGSLPSLLSGGTIRESIGMCNDVLGMRSRTTGNGMGQQDFRRNFTQSIEMISRMAYAAGAAAIRSSRLSSPPPEATGADLYIPDNNRDGTGIAMAVIVQANSVSASGWSRSVALGNVVVNAAQGSFSSVALETGEDFMLAVTRYGSSEATNEMFPPGASHTDDLLPSVVSVVVPAFEEGTSTELAAPISIRFDAVNQSNASSSGPTCMWWDYEADGWSDAGCTTVPVEGTPGSYDCQCTHLTHFAVLFQQDPAASTQSSDEEASLEIATFVGMGLGIVGALATVIVLASARSLVKLPQMILSAMLCTHVLMLITFLAAVDKSNHSSDGSCTFVAYVLHYLLTSTMAWMLCEGWHLYHRFVQVMGVEETFWKFALFGWGSPLAWVVIGAAGFGEDYGTVDLCWIASGSPALYLLIVPVGITIVVNGLFFWAVMRVITTAQSDKGAGAAAQVKAVLTFASTLGLFYIFAILVFATGHIAFQYLLALTATSQGVVVFYFHIWRRPDFRDHIGRSWRILRTGDARKMSTSTSNRSSSITGSSKKATRGGRRSTVKVGRSHNTNWRLESLAKTSATGQPRFVADDGGYLEVDSEVDAEVTEGFGFGDNVSVGSRVAVEGKGNGVVRFVGLHAENGKLRIGVELDDPVGKNNGTVKGHTYFTCKDNHGSLVSKDKVSIQ